MASTITELETTGANIVASAQTMSATDQAAATGTSRIATAERVGQAARVTGAR